ncbi:MAG: hypothetical protein ACOVOO_01945, partial [Flavobacteriales bacterium]
MLKNYNAILLVMIFLCSGEAWTQLPGAIIQPSSGTVLDPNNDGWTSLSNTGFVSNDMTESEIQFVALPVIDQEPNSDLESGPNCNFTDLVGTSSVPPSMISNDGNNLIFRFRLGSALDNTKGYSVLLDTDELFGVGVDPNATATNPGFEVEICLKTNFGVYIYNVDGTCPGVPAFSYPGNSNYQKSKALSNFCANPDFFYDFFVTLADLNSLGITSSTPLRFAATTQMNNSPALCNSALSDIGGLDNSSCGGNTSVCFEILIDQSSGTTLDTIGGGILLRSVCPQLSNTTVRTTTTSISGTCSEANGTVIRLYVNGVLANSTTLINGSFTFNPIGVTLTEGDVLSLSSLAAGKTESYTNCSSLIVSTLCSNALNAALSAECTPKKGFFGDPGSAEAGAIIRVYNFSGTLQTPNAGSVYSAGVVTANANGSWIWKCNGNNSCSAGANNCLSSGTYFITQQGVGKCESEPIPFCIGTGGLTTGTPTINSPIAASASNISGTAPNNSYVWVYLIAGNTELIGVATASATGVWSLPVSNLAGCNTIRALAVSSGACPSAWSSTVTVTIGQTLTPSIADGYCTSTSISEVNGTSSEGANVNISLYSGATLLGTTVTDEFGIWTVSGLTLTPPLTLTATAQAPCKTVSGLSNAVQVQSASVDALFVFNDTNPDESDVSFSGSASPLNTVTLFVDGQVLGSTTASPAGSWTISGWSSSELYAGGNLTATSTSANSCNQVEIDLGSIDCVGPNLGIDVQVNSNSICSGSVLEISILNSQIGFSYTPVVNGVAIGLGIAGDGGQIIVETLPIAADAQISILVSGIGGVGCQGTLLEV